MRGLPGAAALWALMSLGSSTLAAPPAAAPPRALFALIIGVNRSPTADAPPLQFADDDAARYLDLFRALGARAYVLSRLDSATTALYPQTAAEAIAPRRADLHATVDSLARDVAQARGRGVRSTLYVIYAGHGEVEDDQWYLTLEDGRLSQSDLMTNVVERTGADQTHVIVDACQAYLLALPRGPGGTRRPASGFVNLEAAGRVGFLLSSSVSGETHEWAGFEAGVFSHEVRSGLYGAADADGDGRVTYPEIAAFVERANAAIVNQRFRPRVLARAPRDGDLLLDLRSRRDQELRFEDPEVGSHYLLESAQGVRLLDFHGRSGGAVHLVKPPSEGPLYLRRLPDGAERTVPRVDGVVRLEQLPVAPSRTETRGAVHEAFGKIFTLAFDDEVVGHWTREDAELRARAEAADGLREEDRRRARLLRTVGLAAAGVAVAAAGAAATAEIWAARLHDDAPSSEAQRDAVTRNQQIDTRNDLALGLSIGAAAAAVGAALLLWPHKPAEVPELEVARLPAGTEVGALWRF